MIVKAKQTTTISLFLVVLLLTTLGVFAVKKIENKAKTDSKAESKKSSIDIPKRIKAVKLVFKFGNAAQIKDALTQLQNIDEKHHRQLFTEIKALFKSKNRFIQRAVLNFVAQVKYKTLDAEVLKLADSEFNEVSLAFSYAARKKKIKATAPAIEKNIAKADFSQPNLLLNEQILTLGDLKQVKSADFLFEKIQSDETDISLKQNILLYFGRAEVKSAAIRSYIEKLVSDAETDVELKPTAIAAAGLLKMNNLIPKMKKQLSDIEENSNVDEKRKYAELRIAIIRALVKLKDKDVGPVLFTMARDDDENVRLAAIRQLASLKSKEAIELLQYKSEHDPSLKVQKAATKAIETITGKKPKKTKDKQASSSSTKPSKNKTKKPTQTTSKKKKKAKK